MIENADSLARLRGQNPLVSIIVNNYNYARYLCASVQSAQKQTYTNIELIVVDDGSTDDSIARLNTLPDDNFKLIAKANGGQASAFNAGFAQSNGDIILFLDSDDALLPQCVERLVAEWQPSLAKLHYALSLIDENGSSMGRKEPPHRSLPHGDLSAEVAEHGGYLSPPSSGNAYSRSFLEKVMPIPEVEWRGHSDVYLFYLAPFYGQIGAINEELGCYRVHPRSMSVLVVNGKFRVHALQKEITVDDRIERLIKPFRERELKRELGIESESYLRLRSRVISLKLSRDTHPHAGDTMASLLLNTIRASWRGNHSSIGRKIVYSAWILLIALLPDKLAEAIVVPAFHQRSCVSADDRV